MEPALFLVFVVVVTIMISLGCAIWFCDHGLPFPWAVGGGACCGVFLVTQGIDERSKGLFDVSSEGRAARIGLEWQATQTDAVGYPNRAFRRAFAIKDA